MWRIISRPQKSKKIWRRRPQTSNVAAWLIFAGEEEDINYASSRGEGRGKEGTQGWGKPSLGIPTKESQRYNVLPFLSTQKTTYFLCLETIFLLWKSRAFLTKTFEKVSHEPCVLSMNLVGKELSLSYFSSPFSVFPPFLLSFLPQRLVGVPPSFLPPPKLRVWQKSKRTRKEEGEMILC